MVGINTIAVAPLLTAEGHSWIYGPRALCSAADTATLHSNGPCCAEILIGNANFVWTSLRNLPEKDSSAFDTIIVPKGKKGWVV